MSAEEGRAISGRLAGWLAFVLALSALNYASRLAPEADPSAQRDFFYRWDTFAAAVIQLAVMAAVLSWIVRGTDARRLLALRRPRSWGTAAGGMLAVLVAIAAFGAVLGPILEPGEEQGLVPEEWRSSRAAPFAANVAVTTLAVPVVEELIYRGAGYSLLARWGPAVAILGTATAFAAGHGLVLGLPILFAFGIGLAWLRRRADSVVPCIVLHGIFNGLAVLVGVLG